MKRVLIYGLAWLTVAVFAVAQQPTRSTVQDDLYYSPRAEKKAKVASAVPTAQDFKKGAKLLEFEVYEKDSLSNRSGADVRPGDGAR